MKTDSKTSNPVNLTMNDQTTRLQITSLTRAVGLFTGASLIWGLMYFWLGETRSGLIPFTYGIFSLASLVLFTFNNNLLFLRSSQLILVLLLPFF